MSSDSSIETSATALCGTTGSTSSLNPRDAPRVVEDSCVLLSCLINLFSACSSCCARFAVRRKVGKAVCFQFAKDNFLF